MPVALKDGYYAVPLGGDLYRLIWLKTHSRFPRKTAKVKSKYKRVFSYKTEQKWQPFALLHDDGNLEMNGNCLLTWTPQQIESIRKAVAVIQRNPHEALWLYKQITAADAGKSASIREK